jgi:hypothetical protein
MIKIIREIKRQLYYKSEVSPFAQPGDTDIIDDNLMRFPSRVYVNHKTTAVEACAPAEALEHYGVKPTIILVRKDGWSLGCTAETLGTCIALWQEDIVMMLLLDQNVPNEPNRTEARLFEIDATSREIQP